MGEVAGGGRTVLFVSHNMAAILSLCRSTLLLEDGCITSDGPTVEDVVDEYLYNSISASNVPLHLRSDREGNGTVYVTSLSIESGNGNSAIYSSDPLLVRIGYKAKKDLPNARFLVAINDELNRRIFFLDSDIEDAFPTNLQDIGYVTCLTDPINISPGRCTVNVAVFVNGVQVDHVANALTLDIESDDFFGTGKHQSRQKALCLIRQEWTVDKPNDPNKTF